MIAASQAYLNAMDKDVQPGIIAQIQTDVINPEATNGATVSRPASAMLWGDIVSVGVNNPTAFATFEGNYWKADGSMVVPPDNYVDLTTEGYVSTEVCGTNGNFVTIPALTITLENASSIIGLSFEFDTAGDNYPTAVTINAFDTDGTTLYADTIAPDSAQYVLEHGFEGVKSIALTFNGMHKPQQRLRIAHIYLGVSYIYGADDIISVATDASVNPVSTELSAQKLTVKLYNGDQRFNPQNPQGVYAYYVRHLPVTLIMGAVGVADLPASKYYTSSMLSTNGDTTTLIATDVLSLLTDKYPGSQYVDTAVSLYTLATNVLNYANELGIIEADLAWELDESLNNITTKSPVPNKPIRECLQMIAMAGKCAIYCDTTQKIIIKPITVTEPVTHFEKRDIAQGGISIDTRDVIRNVIVKSYSYKASAEQTTLGTCYITGSGRYTINYNAAKDVTFEPSYGTLSNIIVGATCASFDATGVEAGWQYQVTVKGYELTQASSDISTVANSTGTDVTISNELIDTPDQAANVGLWLKNYLTRRNKYVVKSIQNYTLQPCDTIAIDTEFEDNVTGTITAVSYTTAALTGTVTMRGE